MLNWDQGAADSLARAAASMRTTHVLLVVTHSSETRYEWTLDNPEQIELARNAFEDARASRYVAARMLPDGSHGEILDDFDPTIDIVATQRG